MSTRLARLALLALVMLAATATVARAEPPCQVVPAGLTLCHGPYALCDTATCRAIPGTKSVECSCPVLNGLSIASLPQLNGSCTPPPGRVYSLFSMQGLDAGGFLTCPTGTSFAQCWNATCVLAPGGTQATCTCPLCPGSFLTPGGGCNVANCSAQILVGAPFPVSGAGACKN